MAPRILTGVDEVKAAVGEHFGFSDWLVVTQERINQFADATGDHQWIHIDVERASGLMKLFLKNRWIGLWPILYGDQVRQTALDNWIFQGTLDVEHLPQPEQEVEL